MLYGIAEQIDAGVPRAIFDFTEQYFRAGANGKLHALPTCARLAQASRIDVVDVNVLELSESQMCSSCAQEPTLLIRTVTGGARIIRSYTSLLATAAETRPPAAWLEVAKLREALSESVQYLDSALPALVSELQRLRALVAEVLRDTEERTRAALAHDTATWCRAAAYYGITADSFPALDVRRAQHPDRRLRNSNFGYSHVMHSIEQTVIATLLSGGDRAAAHEAAQQRARGELGLPHTTGGNQDLQASLNLIEEYVSAWDNHVDQRVGNNWPITLEGGHPECAQSDMWVVRAPSVLSDTSRDPFANTYRRLLAMSHLAYHPIDGWVVTVLPAFVADALSRQSQKRSRLSGAVRPIGPALESDTAETYSLAWRLNEESFGLDFADALHAARAIQITPRP